MHKNCGGLFSTLCGKQPLHSAIISNLVSCRRLSISPLKSNKHQMMYALIIQRRIKDHQASGKFDPQPQQWLLWRCLKGVWPHDRGWFTLTRERIGILGRRHGWYTFVHGPTFWSNARRGLFGLIPTHYEFSRTTSLERAVHTFLNHIIRYKDIWPAIANGQNDNKDWRRARTDDHRCQFHSTRVTTTT